MTIEVTAFEILIVGFLLGGLCGVAITAFVFFTKIRRALGTFQRNCQRMATSLSTRIPQMTVTAGQLGMSAALIEFTTGIINDLSRGLGRKDETRDEPVTEPQPQTTDTTTPNL